LVHGSPSEHGALLGLWVQPAMLSQLSVVQGVPSSHAVESSAAPEHLPKTQVSLMVQAFASVQVASMGRKRHPLEDSQESSVHGLLSRHAIGCPRHFPALQLSNILHALPSSQALLSSSVHWLAFSEGLHTRHGCPAALALAGTQTPPIWHTELSGTAWQ
jgi:hypothetical protein